ncbi:MAG: FtsH protease activity modulator HflK [Acidobacteriota bacterium]
MSDPIPIDFSRIRLPRLTGMGAGRIGRLVLVAVVVLLALTSWFQVGPESVGIVLQLGAYNREVGPGLHFRIPLGVERVYIVEVQRQLKEEFGFRTLKAGVNTRYATGNFENESLMLTGDLNVAEVQWIVQYRITEPYKFLFRVRDVRNTFRYMTQAVVREMVGDRTINEVLTVGRAELALAVQERLQNLCDQYETGLNVDQVILQDVTPPEEVKASFNEVNQAQQQKETLVNQARAEYNRAVPEAKGVAQQTIQQGEGYALDRVNRARGDASRFDSVHAEYLKAPEVTRQRLYLETLQNILPAAGRKLVVDGKAGNIVPLLPLGGDLSGLLPAPAKGGAK